MRNGAAVHTKKWLSFEKLPLELKSHLPPHDSGIRQSCNRLRAYSYDSRVEFRDAVYFDSATRVEYQMEDKGASFHGCRRSCHGSRRVLAVSQNPVSRFLQCFLTGCRSVCLPSSLPTCSSVRLSECLSGCLSGDLPFRSQFFVSVVVVVLVDRSFNGWNWYFKRSDRIRWPMKTMHNAMRVPRKKTAKYYLCLLGGRRVFSPSAIRRSHLHLPFYLYFIVGT